MQVARSVGTLDELLKLTPQQLARVDIAEMNLLCATGLPGAEKLDIDACLARLNEWAAQVSSVTHRHLYRVTDPRYADEYKKSEAYFRAYMLLQTLQEDCGVHYNMERAREVDFTKSKDLFLHGLVGDANGGTCISMPVVYAAVGRRLGYPIKLVLTKAHVFCRWDDGTERFNIEGTDHGFGSFDDEHYKTWPLKWTPQEQKANRYLLSLTPAEELACFMASRGHCLLDTRRTREALDAYAAAHRRAPKDPAYLAYARQAARRLRPPMFATRRGSFPEPPLVYRDPTPDLHRINAANRTRLGRVPLPPTPTATQPPTPYHPQPGFPNPTQPPTSGFPQPYPPPAPGRTQR